MLEDCSETALSLEASSHPAKEKMVKVRSIICLIPIRLLYFLLAYFKLKICLEILVKISISILGKMAISTKDDRDISVQLLNF